MALLAFGGRRKNGKTALAHMIQDFASDIGLEKPEILSFATPLKELYCELNSISMESLLLTNIKEQHRVGMQDLSTQVKAEEPTYFSDRLLAKINPAKNQIVDDLRLFDLELLPLRAKGAYIWYVYSDFDQRRLRGVVYDPIVDNSAYETELYMSAHTYLTLCGTGWIFNNKGLDELKTKASELTSKYFLNF